MSNELVKLMPDKEYFASLPKKRMGASILFFQGEKLLILKPNYKPFWLLPGGVVDGEESPLTGAIREVREELSLEKTNLTYMAVDYLSTEGDRTEALQFVFHGGELSDEDVSRIKLQESELLDFRFVPLAEAYKMMSIVSGKRYKNAIEYWKKNKFPCYMEEGEIHSL